MSTLKDKIGEITSDISDIFDLDYAFDPTTNVPSVDNSSMTYESGKAKRGKTIETCVLFEDIRDSVKLNDSHYVKTMGRIYTAFTKSVLKLADYHNGYARNIIGDRVMVVFPQKDCFKNAVDCEISINHMADIIASKSGEKDFKCGIGIDYGKMSVIKVGIQMQGKENRENKGLVWVGKPANMASRLTDMANKSINVTKYRVSYNFRDFINPYSQIGLGSIINSSVIKTHHDYSAEELASSLLSQSGVLHIQGIPYIIDFCPVSTEYKYDPILISETVYDGFKKACPNYNSVKNNSWKLQNGNIKDVDFKVYGANLNWKLD